MLHPSTAFFGKVSTKSPRVSCRMPPARARTKRLSPFGSSTGTPRPMFVASTPDRRQVSWLADRRLALPSRRHIAASGVHGRDFPLTVAGAAADLADAGAVASPHSLFAL